MFINRSLSCYKKIKVMQYPLSPFNANFDVKTLLRLMNDVPNGKIQIQNEVYLKKLLKWLCTSPAITSFRVNTLTHTVNEIQPLITNEITKIALQKFSDEQNTIKPKIEIHPTLPEVILLRNWDSQCLDLEIKPKEVIVDVTCAAAVLRGAHIFAPGIIGMLSGINMNDKVSIYADLSGQCKKGLPRKYNSPEKVFIGNGMVRMVRHELFGENLKPEGIAVEVTDTTSKCPSIGDNFLPQGSVLLQNIPSIVCSHVLNPKPGEIVLDMCASPGNKTTHIAALMQNKGTLVALDKTPTKIHQLESRCNEFQAKVHIFQADSTKILNIHDNVSTENLLKGPPYPPEVFDKILLDAPCSALGRRPQLFNNVSEKVVKSYVPLQRKLFENAVHLLKVNGRLVYSTCTITLAENEGIVAWALRTFSCLELIKADPHLGGHGLEGTDLTDLQRTSVQRFGPDQEVDSVGFFIACFIKRNKS